MGPRARARGNQQAKLLALHAVAASMGPRARARGNMLITVHRVHGMTRFNGATSARSWKCRGDAGGEGEASASMGPRARARGNPVPGAALGHGYFASMGPRARARGNTPLAIATMGGDLASMGPRARARGNKAPSFSLSKVPCCFNGATSARSWKCRHCVRLCGRCRASMGPRARARGNVRTVESRSATEELQWGHERALVEI